MTEAGSVRGSTAPEREIRGYLRRVEGLGRQLLGARFEGAQGLWSFQLGLLSLQQEIQSSLGREKGKPKRTRNFNSVEQLRECLYRARQLGDAFAWILFGLDDHKLRPLMRNSRVPVAQDHKYSRGLLALAELLAGKGWGFPLLHDVTDCIRIGDLTFVRPSGQCEPTYLTLEAKTTITGETVREDGSIDVEYQVKLASAVEFDADTGRILSAPLPRTQTPESTPARARAERQARRMVKASLQQVSESGRVMEIDGGLHVGARVDSASRFHWGDLRRVIRASRQSGYAAFSPAPGIVYAALFSKDGVTREVAERGDFLPDLDKFDFLSNDLPAGQKNVMVIYPVPPYRPSTGIAPGFLPFFLYSIPKRAIFEIVRGQLLLVAMVNLARIAEFLQQKGYTVFRRTKGPRHEALDVRGQIENAAGERFEAELCGFESYVDELVYGFRAIDYLADLVDTLLRSSVQGISDWRQAQPAPG